MKNFDCLCILRNQNLVLELLQAQDDPQDVADIACGSSTSIYEFTSIEGVIESQNYPNDYPEEGDCQWYLNPSGGIPDGQVSITFAFPATIVNSCHLLCPHHIFIMADQKVLRWKTQN